MKSHAIVVPSIRALRPQARGEQDFKTPLLVALNTPSRFRKGVTRKDVEQSIIKACKHSHDQLRAFGIKV